MLGKLSGRHAFKDKLETMGYVLDDEAFDDAFRRFKDLADRKKHVFDEDIAALVDDGIMRGHDTIVDQGAAGGSRHRHRAHRLHDPGRRRRGQAAPRSSGDGPVDAIFKAIRELYPHTATLQLFQINAVTEGTDAQATVSVRLEENGRTVTGKASDTDTMAAAAYAYVNALNKLLVKRAEAGARSADCRKMTMLYEMRRPRRRAPPGPVFHGTALAGFGFGFPVQDI